MAECFLYDLRVHAYFDGPFACIRAERQNRGRGATNVLYDLAVPRERTSPPDHIRDERGHALAWAMKYADDPDSSPALRELWAEIRDALAADRDFDKRGPRQTG